MTACTEEPKQTDELTVKPLVQVICRYDDDNDEFNDPADPPEYLIINSARDLANVPEGYLAFSTHFMYSKIDYAKNTLIVVTSVMYCEPKLEDESWNWAMARFDLMKDYSLNIRYSNCSVIPNS
ncbi:MAG: hypothetical protein K2H49_04205, partial [Muribaculaceae bacterium]|nr:hypothetical protein [Muribaculaceae bacterium]